MADILDYAPGAPGIPARWTSSAKAGVGAALSPKSPVWFTLSHGIVNEVYYPRVDSACIRDLELLVTGPGGYFAEEKRDCRSITRPREPGVPAYDLANVAVDGRFRIQKTVITDPQRPVLLQRIVFSALAGDAADYHLYTLLAPHLVNAGMDNSAWLAEIDGVDVLIATGRSRYLALACDPGWRSRSAGFVGVSDGYQLLRQHGGLTPGYQRADGGNVALCGEIDLAPGRKDAVLALGFGQSETEAGRAAIASLRSGFDAAAEEYMHRWRQWQSGLEDLDRDDGPRTRDRGANLYRISTSVLATHRAVDRPGAVVASLSIPWGFSKGDGDLGGYHLVWPRDLVETAGAFLAAGDAREALAILGYLSEVQLNSGRWPQNLWLDGRPYWSGTQMDECAFPILLADLLHRKAQLRGKALARFLPMIRRAAGYIVTHGPATGQDRWEEDGGYSPFTLAAEIAALLAAADLLEQAGDAGAARHLRETADCWNDQIENWTFAGDPELCAQAGVSGYYVRIVSGATTDAARAAVGLTAIRNQVPGRALLPTRDVLSPDALALVRFGLRAPDDPRIRDTVKAIDAHLRVELPQGPLWYRYTNDGYGEHADGAPFDGTGQGRPWPLLVGERAHYELAAGRIDTARALLRTLEASASDEGLLPEQSWDGDDIPGRELFRGRPAGSAMPLVWAHGEHIKLLRSLAEGSVFDMPPQGVERYQKNRIGSDLRIWRANNRLRFIAEGKRLRLELEDPALVHWSTDGWTTTQDLETRPSGLGSHVADLDTSRLGIGTAVSFTFLWAGSNRWESVDYEVVVRAATTVAAKDKGKG